MPPRVSFVVFAYRHEPFILEAVRAAFAQDYAPLEIILSDDGSRDGTFAIMEREAAGYRGPHTVVLNRNSHNLGGPGHHNRIMELARGDLVVVAHGDDISLPHRTRRLVETWQAHGASLVTSDAEVVDRHLRSLGRVCGDAGVRRHTRDEMIASSSRYTLVGATMAWTPEVFTRFGAIDTEAFPIGPTDQLLPLRAAFLEGVVYLGEPLLLWRQHPGNTHRHSSNKTQGEAAMEESTLASLMNVKICMFENLLRLRGQEGAAPWIEDGLRQLSARIFYLSRQWMRARNQLVAQGQRPVWIDRQSYEAMSLEEEFIIQPGSRDRPPVGKDSPGNE